MLQPKRVKYRRPQDGRGNKGNAHRGTTLAFGSFGIKTLEAIWLDSRQIEAARVAVNRYRSLVGKFQKVYTSQKRGFTGAGRTDYRQNLTFFKLKIYSL